MALSNALASQVSSQVKGRGRQYYSRRVVHLNEGDADHVEATVQGTELYGVSLSRKKKTVVAYCSCPYFLEYEEPCKHIWATILAAETKGYLQGTGSAPRYLEPDIDRLLEAEELADKSYHAEPRRDVYSWYRPSRQSRSARQRGARRPGWKQTLEHLREEMQREEVLPGGAWPAGREIIYMVDLPSTLTASGLTIDVGYRSRKQDGEWSKPKFVRISSEQIPQIPDEEDRRLLSLLAGAQHTPANGYGHSHYDSAFRFQLSEPMQEALVPALCRTGRFWLRRSQEATELQPITWDDRPPWEFWLEVARDPAGKHYTITGSLRRGEERMPIATPHLLTKPLVFWDEKAARLQDSDAFDWITLLRREKALSVPVKQHDTLLAQLLQLPRLPRLDLPEELHFEEAQLTPRPRLKVRAPEHRGWGGSSDRLRGELSFDYGGTIVSANQAGRGIYQAEQRRLLLRDTSAEKTAVQWLQELGFKPVRYYNEPPGLELAPRNLPRVIRTLLGAGWHVEAEGKLYRQPEAFQLAVRSGIDWFELHGGIQFGDNVVGLPALLAAVKRGDNTVQLGDGTFGVLPEDWLKKYGLLAGLGTAEDGHLRFARTQVGLLDALLAQQQEVAIDTTFARLRDELHRFAGVQPVDPPASFVGRLREYQREGLGWLGFLQQFGFGGCLADDMGLGKTVQVLALMESRRLLRAEKLASERPSPSLVVVPRSLVFNWKQEAARFTPQLKVLDHTGIGRGKPSPHFHEYDLVLTTYGTLRRDVLHFKDFAFDYCILDEAQAIKNASSESAKAARLLRGQHRLALSGTPVENHLGELWSLFEFLNPSMLGGASVLRLGEGTLRNPSEETRTLLARAIRPFLLRRTKEQVAKDLPQKVEQTIYCEMESAQRKLYDELRDHYRQSLLGRVEKSGINKCKIQILEALLRLRQAACHPGLVDKERTPESSAKLDALLPQLAEVLDEGHKALVFSQFTSLLAIVRERLDHEKVVYEYLDGRTRDRASRVERFQNDPNCKLFLISLKAGGLGLNLTAAEYVFLLDPWWNPAVEAQAIDRTHRIGQSRPVFAYRLIARDTVEEKVLELQKTKRALADAIVNADNSLIRSLAREDLELLLS
jgi:hypothetical protein